MDQVQAKVSDVYCSLARQYSCALAPSGIAYVRERKFYPDYDLYASQSDRVHPNLSGSYLSACCIYATLFGKNPENLSYTSGNMRVPRNHWILIIVDIAGRPQRKTLRL